MGLITTKFCTCSDINAVDTYKIVRFWVTEKDIIAKCEGDFFLESLRNKPQDTDYYNDQDCSQYN